MLGIEALSLTVRVDLGFHGLNFSHNFIDWLRVFLTIFLINSTSAELLPKDEDLTRNLERREPLREVNMSKMGNTARIKRENKFILDSMVNPSTSRRVSFSGSGHNPASYSCKSGRLRSSRQVLRIKRPFLPSNSHHYQHHHHHHHVNHHSSVLIIIIRLKEHTILTLGLKDGTVSCRQLAMVEMIDVSLVMHPTMEHLSIEWNILKVSYDLTSWSTNTAGIFSSFFFFNTTPCNAQE